MVATFKLNIIVPEATFVGNIGKYIDVNLSPSPFNLSLYSYGFINCEYVDLSPTYCLFITIFMYRIIFCVCIFQLLSSLRFVTISMWICQKLDMDISKAGCELPRS